MPTALEYSFQSSFFSTQTGLFLEDCCLCCGVTACSSASRFYWFVLEESMYLSIQICGVISHRTAFFLLTATIMRFLYLKGLSVASLPILILLSKRLCFTTDVTKLQGFTVCGLSGSFLHQQT
jgi:hypothetical protein